MDLDKAISQRCSIRDFAKKKVHWDKIIEAIDAASKAPFAGNINTLHFVIVENQKTKEELADCCVQDWIASASIVVVACSDESQLERMYQERGRVYCKQQCGAAIQNFILKLTDLGLGSCWVGAYSDDTVRKALKIPEKIHIEAIIPIGVPEKKIDHKQAKKSRIENLIYWEKWGIKKKPRRTQDPPTW